MKPYMTAKNPYTGKLSKTLKSLWSQKKGNLPLSVTKGQDAPKELTSYSLTTTLSAPLAGLPQSLKHLKKDPIVRECRGLLLSLQSFDVTGTFSLLSSSSPYTICGFVDGNEVFLDISHDQALGQPEPVIPPANTKGLSISLKLAICLSGLMFLMSLVGLMKSIAA